MKRFMFAVCSAVVLLALPASAIAQPAHVDSRKVDFYLSSAIVVGTTTVQPGEYKFQCRKIGDKEFLVITFADNGKEVARVPCRPEMLDKKVAVTEYRSTTRPDGTSALTAVRIKGEMIAHNVVE